MRCLPLADDCGISAPVTDAIFQCLDAGGLRGASVIAGGACAVEAARALGGRLYKNPDISIGIHLNLLEGRSVSSPADVPMLVDEQGWFRRGLGGLWTAVTLSAARKKQALLEQMVHECRAQVDVVRTAVHAGWHAAFAQENPGAAEPEECPFSFYLDGHLHIHAIPAFQPVLAAVLDHYSFSHVRTPVEARCFLPAPLSLQLTGGLRRELLGLWGRGLRSFLDQRGVAFPDFFVGAFASCNLTLPVLEKALRHVRDTANSPDALVEIMFHPFSVQANNVDSAAQPPSSQPLSEPSCSGIAARQAALGKSYATPGRRAEAAMLLSPDFQRLMLGYDPSWPTVQLSPTAHPGKGI